MYVCVYFYGTQLLAILDISCTCDMPACTLHICCDLTLYVGTDAFSLFS